MIGAVETQVPLAEGGIDKGAVVRTAGIVVHAGPEEAAGKAHLRDRDLAALLQAADHLQQRAVEDLLFTGLQVVDGGEQEVGPERGLLRLQAALLGQREGNGAAVVRVGPLATRPLRTRAPTASLAVGRVMPSASATAARRAPGCRGSSPARNASTWPWVGVSPWLPAPFQAWLRSA